MRVLSYFVDAIKEYGSAGSTVIDASLVLSPLNRNAYPVDLMCGILECLCLIRVDSNHVAPFMEHVFFLVSLFYPPGALLIDGHRIQISRSAAQSTALEWKCLSNVINEDLAKKLARSEIHAVACLGLRHNTADTLAQLVCGVSLNPGVLVEALALLNTSLLNRQDEKNNDNRSLLPELLAKQLLFFVDLHVQMKGRGTKEGDSTMNQLCEQLKHQLQQQQHQRQVQLSKPVAHLSDFDFDLHLGSWQQEKTEEVLHCVLMFSFSCRSHILSQPYLFEVVNNEHENINNSSKVLHCSRDQLYCKR